MVDEAAIQELKKRLRGRLLRPGDDGYDAARKVWNGMIDKRPAFIARCSGAADVVESVRFAREHDLLVSIRGGGHNYAGKSVCDDGLMIDLSPMKGIRVDPVGRTAWAQAGLKLGEFDRETQAFGLATTLGVNTDTGIAGLTLGGGYGWLAGKYGLACDNLLSVDIVTAEGKLLHASAEENPELFWGVRGAGANLGIVTSFEYRLHPVGPVLGGIVFHSLSTEALRFFYEFSSAAPNELTAIGVLGTMPEGSPALATVVCYCGPIEQGENLFKPLRTFSPPLADLIAQRPYVEMQSVLDEFWPPGRLYYNKAHNIRTLSDGAIEIILAYFRAVPTSLSNIALQQLHGASSHVPASETAFPHRYDHYDLMVHPATQNPDDCKNMIRWARECWQALQPFVEQAVYVNALEDAVEEGEKRVREAYGPNYERLVALKNKYDPTNFFRLNANIKPTL